jgi:predicted metal-binding protein
MKKYLDLAKELGLTNAVLISPKEISFDLRALLKCRWGCEDYFQDSLRCSVRGTTFEERLEMIKRYKHILLLHSHDAGQLSRAVLAIERAAFLDGHYFAFAIRTCNLCRVCAVQEGKFCPTPEKVRPCDQGFGIDVYKTVGKLGLPCNVLQRKDDLQNRYGFVLID